MQSVITTAIVYLLIIFMPIMHTGCSGNNNDSNPVASGPAPSNPSPVIDGKYNGTYDVVASSITFGCGNANGVMNINESDVSGSVTDTWGQVYDLSGSVQADGSISFGLADGSSNYARFEGLIVDMGSTIEILKGSGTWEDNGGCAGNWEALKRY